MDEEVFWEIIASFNWKKTGDDDAVMKPALKRLVSMTVDDIKQFAEILAAKLYELDGLAYASNMGLADRSQNRMPGRSLADRSLRLR